MTNTQPSDFQLVDSQKLKSFITSTLVTGGAGQGDAEFVAEVLVEADLR